MSEENQNNQNLTQEELDQINKDIAAAREKLVSKETSSQIEKAKQEAKQEAQKEFETSQKLKELEEQRKALEEKLQNTEKQSSEQLEALKKKVDEMAESKRVMQAKNPFADAANSAGSPNNPDPENMTDEEVNDIERASGRAFFGPEYDKPL